MKILLICERFNIHSINIQPWKHVFEIAKGLQKRGHEICILTDTLSIKESTIEELHVKSIKKGKFLFNMQELNKSVSEGFDIINWNASSITSGFYAKHLRKNIRGSFFWTLHSGIIDPVTLHNLKISDIPLLTSLWNHAIGSVMPTVFLKNIVSLPHFKAIITLSKRMKKYLSKLGIAEEIIHVIHSGVDADKYVPRNDRYTSRVKEELGFKIDEPIILYYGPLNSARGVDELIKAIPKVSKLFNKVRFVFLGRTAKYDLISCKLKKNILNIKNALLVEGFLEQNSLLNYLYAADIIVLPFRFWPYVECPLTVLEVMALGKPLITTCIGAIPEIVYNNYNGLLVNPRSEEMAKAVLKLLKNNDLAIKLGHNARNYVIRYHSWKNVIDKTERLFEKSIV